MPFSLAPFSDAGLDQDLLELVIDEHRSGTLPRLTKWWAYFRNAERGASGAGWGPGQFNGGGKRTGLAQEAGLPARLTGHAPTDVVRDVRRSRLAGFIYKVDVPPRRDGHVRDRRSRRQRRARRRRRPKSDYGTMPGRS